MESEKKQWTEEDKYWAFGGVAIAVAGGIYWYIKNKKKPETEALPPADSPYIDFEKTETSTQSGSSTETASEAASENVQTPVATTRQPDAARWAVGQEMMANVESGTKTYIPKKKADGSYTNLPVRLSETFEFGTRIGKIIWVGLMSDGTYRYVLEDKKLILSDYYWVADYRAITSIDRSKPISTIKNPVAPTTTSGLNTTLILKRGSKGKEVSELQKRLGITIDGDFGSKTETALYAQKRVYQITLAGFAAKNVSTLNFNLMLKKGVKGLEVKELQKRLGFTGSNVDGDFGTKTESALFAMKAVKQTTLNQFSYV